MPLVVVSVPWLKPVLELPEEVVLPLPLELPEPELELVVLLLAIPPEPPWLVGTLSLAVEVALLLLAPRVMSRPVAPREPRTVELSEMATLACMAASEV